MNCFSMVWILLLLVWSQSTTGSVYTVVPDDHYYPNTTCHHCHNLQHYLLNATKYFTSKTQLLFLPGLHHLHTDLIIQNVCNVSLIGSTTNGTTSDTVIQCNSSVGIVLSNITNLIVANITVSSCLGNEYNNATVLIKQCKNVHLRRVVVEESHNSYGIVGINILGHSHFSDITSNVLNNIYNDTTVDMVNHSLIINNYHNSDGNNFFQHKMIFKLFQRTYGVSVRLLHSIFQGLTCSTAIDIKFNNDGLKQNIILIKYCQFFNSSGRLISIDIIEGYKRQQIEPSDNVHIDNCEFFSNYHITQCGKMLYSVIHTMHEPLNMQITNCNFHHNNYEMLRKALYFSPSYAMAQITIENTTFVSNMMYCQELIFLSYVNLHLIGPVVFYNNTNATTILYLRHSNVTCFNYIELTHTESKYIIVYYEYAQNYLLIKENSNINVTYNKFEKFAETENSWLLEDQYHLCFFQYIKDENISDTQNYSIMFKHNNVTSEQHAYNNLPITHCCWLPQSPFNTTIPLEVNKKFIKYTNSLGTFNLLPQRARKKTMCDCSTNTSYDCYRDATDSVYPGQTMTLNVYLDVAHINGFKFPDMIITVINDVDWLPTTACVVTNYSIQTAKSHTCHSLQYSISFSNEYWCELFLKGYSDGIEKMDIYYINQKPCPPGFIKLDGTCQCYPYLKQFNIKCDINRQTLIRPSAIWITPIQHKNDYGHQISLHCPFQYCLPHSSYLNISTPNSQCQFNRSGTLCGHRQQGLSTLFGSSNCKQCSNIYLFLIIPIAIAGFVLVLLLFILNLTVTDGTINAFILYVNIISINNTVFFPKSTPANVFISLANLDLGIQTCFYNGMDDYAKMWLQLAFPIYLIFIATSLIITSRYSTTIQRLTARRALPALATLFLLSYTKILLTVSSVLFYYSKVIHLPSGHTTLVWSVDANVPLFGVRFTVIFLMCLILFIILIPFNVILLFTRTLSRFRLISKFKPLLDAYQGPYKVKFYYWTGFQLLIRILLFAISSLDRDINLIIGMVLLSILGGLHGTLHPFKNEVKNYQELIIILNLQVMYTISLYGRENVTSVLLNVMIAIAIVQFMIILCYHVAVYANGGVIRRKIMQMINNLNRWVNDLHCIHQIELEPPKGERIFANQYYIELQEPLVV